MARPPVTPAPSGGSLATTGLPLVLPLGGLLLLLVAVGARRRSPDRT